MFNRTWCVVFAVVGFLTFPCLADPPNATDYLPQNIDRQKGETNYPVEASKSNGWLAAANTYLGITRCIPYSVNDVTADVTSQEQRYYDSCDLSAQEIAASSARWMFVATILQTLIGLLGTVLVIGSLRLTRRATDAAVQANQNTLAAIGQEQANAQRALRAYVSYECIKITSCISNFSPEFQVSGYDFAFQIKNFGQTPAYKVKFSTAVGTTPITDLNAKAVTLNCHFNPSDSPGYLGPGEKTGLHGIFINTDEFFNARSSGAVKTICIHVKYFDAFDQERNYRMLFGVKVVVDIIAIRLPGGDATKMFETWVIGPNNGGD